MNRKQTLAKKQIRCPGRVSGRKIRKPMKATLFVNTDSRLNVAVLYTDTGFKIGTFNLEGLDALEVLARTARRGLFKLVAENGSAT